MKRLFPALLLLAAAPVFAQQTPSETQKPVATVNGEVITAAQLDQMYDKLPPEMQDQYRRTGGKAALLDNYIRKRLLLQEAVKAGFDKRPDVRADLEAARESALFESYIRDVVSEAVVSDAAMKQYYQQHLRDFAAPEMIKVRQIAIPITDKGPRQRSKEQAMEKGVEVATKVLTTIPRADNPAARAAENAERFAQIARQYSEDGAASIGGDLGWVTRAQLSPDFADAAFALPTGVPSGIVQTSDGLHIIYVEGRRAAGTQSFDEAKPVIRNILLNEHRAEIIAAVDKLTSQLAEKGKVAIYPENIQ